MISIIIPAYNSAATIVEALDSVLAQTLDPRPQTIDLCEAQGSNVNGLKSNVSPRYEVIIVDDCSKDNTVEVVRDWIAQNSPSNTSHVSRFTLHTLPANGGPAKARNSGIAAAQGDWIAFLDADDAWFPQKLELQVNLAAIHPEAMLWCGEYVGFPAEGSVSVLETKTQEQQANCMDAPLHPITLEELAVRNPIATSTVMVRRDALLSVGGFDEQFIGPEDYDLWLRLLAWARCEGERMDPQGSRTGQQAIGIDLPLVRYRTTVGSLSHDDRKFLPQVLRVQKKAFGPGGALSGLRHLRRRALAAQYYSASWMAFLRGARLRALCLLGRAFLAYPLVEGRHQIGLWHRYLTKAVPKRGAS